MKHKLTAKENIAKLPDTCFGILSTDHSIIRICAGESGYYRVPQPQHWYQMTDQEKEDYCNRVNEGMCVTRAQREAMEQGSMFGWELPIATAEFWEAQFAKKAQVQS